jgi:guanylate kinase
MRRGSRGIPFVISAPSGSGKSTLVGRLLEEVSGLAFSISYTTRPRRPGERDGREYHFVDETRFDAMTAEDGFLEWAEVFGRRYGTGREVTEKVLEQGRDLVLDIDVQGARQIRDRGLGAVFVFLLPPDFRTLEARLRDRHSDSEAQVARRLAQAREEAEEYRSYDYLVINDDLDGAAAELCHIVEAERRRIGRRRAEADRILSSFPGSRSG